MRGTAAVISVPVATVWTGPDAPRPLDRLVTARAPDVSGWLDRMGLDELKDLHGRILTQALLGEPVAILQERAGWALVELPAQPSHTGAIGYAGWVVAAHLTEPPDTDGHPDVVVSARIAEAGDERGERVELSWGTRLVLIERRDHQVRVAAPDGRVLVLGAAAVAPARGPLDTARQLLGLPYLWGGCSGYGVDCSGLAHLAHRVVGNTIPRDADDQALAGAPVAVADSAPGDLVFFTRPDEDAPHHVGLWIADAKMLHSPRTGLTVEEGDSGAEPYRSERLPELRRYGRATVDPASDLRSMPGRVLSARPAPRPRGSRGRHRA